ncbi:unnamed protein product [Phytophthora fragariaefolia]|uniref:Unnamed protein product n=1 Tax=Phytophthora fragariaefolia TaxID=1490495 RepID=A0A9W7D3F0_9STRA|nr:unnamed protein product [Phytophthora fragariaefolia]
MLINRAYSDSVYGFSGVWQAVLGLDGRAILQSTYCLPTTTNPNVLATMATSIALDGSSSDLARQFYYRAKAGDATVGKVTINAVPDAVQNRLTTLKLDWSKLPGVAQYALLWDSGYAVNVKNDAVQMWTLGDNNMSSLALTLDEFEAADCTPTNCTQPDNTTLYANLYCNGAQMNNAVKCIVEEFDDGGKFNAAMWAIGGNPDVAPQPRMVRHEWVDGGSGIQYFHEWRLWLTRVPVPHDRQPHGG